MQETTKMFDWNDFVQSDFILRKDSSLQSNQHTLYSKDQGKSAKDIRRQSTVSSVKLNGSFYE